MKKLLNKKFILILASTITLLVVLTIAMIFLTKENTKTFIQGGYIIASGKEEESSTKYYFDEGTSYKTNVNLELVFKDTSGEKVNVETNNFLHYKNGGIKFLKNGVIMDLESLDSKIVPYYNITNKSILEYSNKSYYIEALDKTLAFNNLVGRISDNKYIFAGTNIKLNLSGSNEPVTGDYFEVTYIKDGIIRVENQEVSYQTTAQNSYILVNDNVRIDLGTKNVYYNEEEKMSLSQMTIDGNENINIDSIDKEDNNGNGGKDSDVTPSPTDSQNPVNTPNGGDNQNPNNNPGGNQGNGGNQTGDNTKRTASIELVKAEVGVNNISAEFTISDPDQSIKNDLVLNIINTDTGKKVYSVLVDKSKDKYNLDVSTLSPESNYIISINEETDGNYDTQYFQKLFKTNELGVTLVKKYVTTSSIAYEAVFEKDTLVKSAKIALYDEKYSPIYLDNCVPGEETTCEQMIVEVTKDSNTVLFEGLKNNTSYNIELSDVIMENMQYNKVYTINKTSKTLKKTPYLQGLTSEVDDVTNTFSIGVQTVIDEDESITKYSYYIYKADDITLDNINTIKPVKVIDANKDTKTTISIDGVDIHAQTNYKFKVVAEYFDNEKYGEYETELSDNLILSGKPSIDKFILDEEKTTINKIVGKLILKDESCTIPMTGRNCSSIPSYKNNFILVYYDSQGEHKIENIPINPYTLDTNLEIDSLLANTDYNFSLYADVDLLDGKGIRKRYLIGNFQASTTKIDILTVEWDPKEDEQDKAGSNSTLQDVVNVKARITSTNEVMANSINNITFSLYADNVASQLKLGSIIEPIATRTVSGNLKDDYYDKYFKINTLDTFEIKDQTIEETITDEEGNEKVITTIKKAIDVLKEKTNGELKEYYTIVISDISDTSQMNELPIENNYYVFKTSKLLLLEDKYDAPTIIADEIKNVDLKQLTTVDGAPKYSSKLLNDTIVGYKISVGANIERINEFLGLTGTKPVKEMVVYACDANTKPNCSVEDAVESKVIDLMQTDNLETYMFLKNGTKYDVVDKELTRGHNYIFKVKFNVDTNNDGEIDAVYPNSDIKTETKSALKESPGYKVYIVNTTENQVTYRHVFTDIDNALYDRKFYYTIDDTIKNQKPATPSKPTEGEDTSEDNQGEDTPEEPYKPEVKEIDFGDGEFTIEGLSTDSVYTLSFKKALIKREREIQTVELGKYIFDGKFTYNANTVSYANITSDNDNRLRIMILENDNNTKYVNRISAYHVVLSAQGEEDYSKVFATSKINKCTSNDKEYKCIIIDYADIKNFKTKDVTVKVTAFYDTGIINNDFTNLPANGIGYLLQVNNYYKNSLTKADYYNLTLNTKGEIIVDTTKYPTGIIEYGKNTTTSVGYTLQIKQRINTKDDTFNEDDTTSPISIVSGADAYNVKHRNNKYMTINNKIVDKVDMYTSNNRFKFNSIIPKINVSTKGLVNGSIITIKPVGLDEEILNNEFQKDSDGKYYYYIKIYKDKEKTEIYKDAKLEINIDSASIELTKYMPDTKYYFEVSAMLKKDNGYKETLLFDARNTSDYVSTTYEFSTLAPSGIMLSSSKPKVLVNHSSKNGIYAYREMYMYMDSSNTIGEYDTRFELYDINGNKLISIKSSDKENGGNFGPSPINKNYYNRSSVTKDVTDMDIVFGSGYYSWKIYIETEVFDSEEKAELLVLEDNISLPELKEPTFSANRVGYETSKLKFQVTVNDQDKVAKDGKYCVELLDIDQLSMSGYPVKCGLDIVDSDGKPKINVEYEYTNLEPGTVYVFRVFSDIYTNNINETKKNRTVDLRQVVTTSTDYGVAIGKISYLPSNTAITLTYNSAINLNKIKKIDYTISEDGVGQIASGSYYGFDAGKLGIYSLVIKPENVTFKLDSSSYLLTTIYYIEQNGALVQFTRESQKFGKGN